MAGPKENADVLENTWGRGTHMNQVGSIIDICTDESDPESDPSFKANEVVEQNSGDQSGALAQQAGPMITCIGGQYYLLSQNVLHKLTAAKAVVLAIAAALGQTLPPMAGAGTDERANEVVEQNSRGDPSGALVEQASPLIVYGGDQYYLLSQNVRLPLNAADAGILAAALRQVLPPMAGTGTPAQETTDAATDPATEAPTNTAAPNAAEDQPRTMWEKMVEKAQMWLLCCLGQQAVEWLLDNGCCSDACCPCFVNILELAID